MPYKSAPKKIKISTGQLGRGEKPFHALEEDDVVKVRFSQVRNRQHDYKVKAADDPGCLDLIKVED